MPHRNNERIFDASIKRLFLGSPTAARGSITNSLIVMYLAIVLICVVVLLVVASVKDRQKKIREQEAKSDQQTRLNSLKEQLQALENELAEAKREATDAKSASEARILADQATHQISDLQDTILGLNARLKVVENKDDIFEANKMEQQICREVCKLPDLVDRAKTTTQRAVAQKKQQLSRKPYTIQRAPFLKAELRADYAKRYFVGYDLKGTSGRNYPIIRTPLKGCEIKLPLVGRQALRGFCEQEFCNRIVELGLADHFCDNLCLALGNTQSAFEPDLAYIDLARGVLVDIEVDEPYAGWNHEPIHYKYDDGSMVDDGRNLCFTDRGWTVIRFSERQIHEQPLSCLKELFSLLHQMDCRIAVPDILKDCAKLCPDPTWTKGEATTKACNRDREKYLNISEFKNTLSVSTSYIQPDYHNGELIEKHIIELREDCLWDKCKKKGDYIDYEKCYPKGRHRQELLQIKDESLWKECQSSGDYQHYINNTQLHLYTGEAKQKEAEAEARQKRNEEQKRLQRENEERRQREVEAELERRRQESRRVSRQNSQSNATSSRGYA